MNKKIIPMLVVASAMMLAGCGKSSSPVTPSSEPTSEPDSSEPSVEPAVTHTVSITGTDGVALSVDKTTAAAGETVTISVVTELDGYRLGRIRVVGNTYDHEVFADESGAYKFTMPDEDVMISYTVDQSYSISYTNLSQSYGYTFASDSAVAAFSNDYVTLTVNYQYGEFDDTSAAKMYLYVNDEIVEYDDYDGSDITFTFLMPAENVSVIFIREVPYATETGHSFTIENADGIKAYGYDPEQTYSSVAATLLKTTGYAIDKITLVGDDGTETDLVANDWSAGYYVSWDGNVGTFRYYGSFEDDVTLKIYSTEVAIHNITYIGDEYIVSELPCALATGDTYSLRLSDLTFEAGYTYSTSGAVATVTGVEPTSNSYGNLYFTMPDADVTIEFTCIIAAQTFNITKDEHVKSVSITDYNGKDMSSCKANSYVYITAEVDDGYMISGMTLNGTALSYSSYAKAWTGSTSSEDGAVQELVITTGAGYNVTTQETEGVSISLSQTTYAAGASVTGTLAPKSAFYTIDGVKLVKDDGSDSDVEVTVTTTYGSTKRFGFTMPEYNVTLVVMVTKTEGVHFGGIVVPEAVTEWRISGNGSGNYIDSSMTDDEIAAVDFAEGETLQVAVTHESGYIISVKIGDGSPVSPYNDSGTSCTIYSGLTMVGGATIEIIATAKQAVNVTVNAPEGATVSVKVSGKAVDTLYVGDNFDVSVSGTPAEGGSFVVTSVTDSEGTALVKDTWDGYSCTGDIIINVSVVQDATYTLIAPDDIAENFSLSYYDGSSWDSTYYNSGDTLPGGAELDYYYYDYSTTVNMVVTVGGVEVINETNYYLQGTITVTGDVVITLTAATAD